MESIHQYLSHAFDCFQDTMYKSKSIHLRYKMVGEHQTFIMRQSILVIYSEWEGFVKKALSIYLQELNRLKLNYCDLDEHYLAYQTDQIASFKNQVTDVHAVIKISSQIYGAYNNIVVFNTNINTESNATLKVVNHLLRKLRLNVLDQKFNDELNKLIKFRNSLAHGDEGIPITQSNLDSFANLVQELSSEIINSIVNGFERAVYLKLN